MKRVSIGNSYKTLPNKKNPTHPDFITKDVYKKINDSFNKILFEELLTTGQEFNIPERLGSLQIVKFKPKNPSVDFAASKKYKTKILHDNLHTDGYAVKLKWNKNNANFKFKKIWDFKLVRHHIRLNKLSIKNFVNQHGITNFIESTFYHADN